MSKPAPMTIEEAEIHVHAIAASSSDKDAFVAAFSAYVEDVVTRESQPFEKIALFVHGMLEGQHEALTLLLRHPQRGEA